MAEAEDPRPFAPIAHNLSPDEIADLEAFAEEGKEEFKKTGRLMDLMGLKSFGATEEGVKSAIGLGAQLVRQGYLVKAAEYFGGLLQLEPFNPTLYLWMGLTAQKLKNYTQARDMFRFSISLDEPQGLAHVYLGEVLLALQDKETALGHLREGIARLKTGTRHKMVLLRAEKVLAAAQSATA